MNSNKGVSNITPILVILGVITVTLATITTYKYTNNSKVVRNQQVTPETPTKVDYEIDSNSKLKLVPSEDISGNEVEINVVYDLEQPRNTKGILLSIVPPEELEVTETRLNQDLESIAFFKVANFDGNQIRLAAGMAPDQTYAWSKGDKIASFKIKANQKGTYKLEFRKDFDNSMIDEENNKIISNDDLGGINLTFN